MALAIAGISGAATRETPAPIQALALALRARGVASVPAPALRVPALPAAIAAYYEVVAGNPAAAAAATRTAATLPGSYRRPLATMLAAMTDAQRLRNRAFALVAPGDAVFADRIATQALFAPDTVRAADAIRARAIVDRVDMRLMAQAAATVQAAAAEAMPQFIAADAPHHVVDFPADAITIGTSHDDVYTADKQLLIDPAGDDTYVNNAGGLLSSQMADSTGGCVQGGGTTGYAPPNMTCTPIGSAAVPVVNQDDNSRVCTYDILGNATGRDDLPADVSVPNHDVPGTGDGTRDGSCGSDARAAALEGDTANVANDGDSRGVAVLLDRSGSDTYTAPWTYEDKMFGLIDFCFHGTYTDHTNTNRDLFQGGALSGISLLWDDGEPGDHNTFRGRLNAQGSGHVGGIGMLFSTAGGDDLYWADRLAQGNGIAGGVGVLVDTGGTNTYLLEPPVVYRNEFRPAGRECSQEGRAGQGEGGFGGVGVLWNQGVATYRAVTHETQVAYPFAPVLDGNDEPVLVAGTDAQGSGESAPIQGTPGGLVAGIGIVVDRRTPDARPSVCAGAGKTAGASYGTPGTPGVVDASCGHFNTEPEISAEELADVMEHLSGGAVGMRVVLTT